MRSDATMWSEPECDVAVGRTVQHDLVGSLEFLFIVIGGQPADDDPVVASEMLPAKDDVASHRSAQLLVDREVAQKFIGRGAVELRVLNELFSQLGMGAQVQQGQRGLRCRGVDAAGDEVPENVEQLCVVEPLAVEFELNE